MFPLVPQSLSNALRDWQVTDDHVARVSDATARIEGGDAARGWAILAEVFERLGATEVALMICRFALTVVGVPDRLYPLRDRYLIALGLATATRFGIEIDHAAVDAWAARALAAVGGDEARAARYALRLAGAKVGLEREPTA